MVGEDRVPRTTAAVLGGLAGLAGSYLMGGSTPEFVAVPVATFVVNTTPAGIVAFSIQRLGHLGDQLAFAFSIALTVGLLALATGVGAELGRRVGSGRVAVAAAVIGAGVVVWIVAAAITQAPVSSLAVALPAAAVVAIVAVGTPDGSPTPGGRRRFAAAFGGVLGFGVVAYLIGRERTMPPTTYMPPPPSVTSLRKQAREKQLDVPGIPGLVSPTGAFYQVDVDAINPMVVADDWSLTITGAVGREARYSYADVRAMPSQTKFKTLRCVGERLNAKLLDNAIWTGVPIMDLIDRAGPNGGCECVMLRAADGYYEEFPLAALRMGFLAYGMNGRSLPRSHGYPVRALIPGTWGEVNVKWLTEIEVLSREASGYWEKRGWHGTGPVNTVAKLWTVNRLGGGRVQVAGHAYAGTRGISRVEVSTDGGATWDDAVLSEPLSESTVLGGTDAWRQWAYTWTPGPGEHRVVVRATDAEGTLQPRTRREAYPNGASGWVSTTVRA